MGTAIKTPARMKRGYSYTPRSARGLSMASINHATRVVSSIWEVKSSDRSQSYTVSLSPIGCTCPDWRYRGCEGAECKHIIAAALMAVGC